MEKAITKNLNNYDSNKTKNTYYPGLDWKLAWSDEFDSDTINPKKWNFHFEKAGNFNSNGNATQTVLKMLI
jgi:hypothetical protein